MRNPSPCVKFRMRKFTSTFLINDLMAHLQEPMLKTVLRRLDDAKGEWPKIAVASGVPYQTITKIGGRFVADPRVSSVQALFDYFAGQPERPKTADGGHTAH